jgi:hypothetical protein
MPLSLPAGLDYTWLAYDTTASIAVFSNAGLGPIPISVLTNRHVVDNADALINSLPVRGRCELLAPVQGSYFDSVSQRGLFSYDWQDVHRTEAKSGCYEIVSRPLNPLLITDLPGALREIAGLALALLPIRFADTISISLSDFIACVT